jgi:hypothetical protein
MKKIVAGVVMIAVGGAVIGVVTVAARHGRPKPAAADPKPSVLSTAADSRSPIVRENDLPGSTGWRLTGAKSRHPIEGFAARTSVAAGQPLDVFVRTGAERFRADVYRMGWYRGTGGRLVSSIPTVAGDTQTPCAVSTDRRRTVACTWHRSFRVSTRSAWVSGVYLVKLSATDGTQSWVPFVVREVVPRAPIVFQASVTTWQAYNAWGGRSLYGGPCERNGSSYTPPPSSDEPQAQPSQPAPQGSPRARVKPAPSFFPSPTPDASPSPVPSPSPLLSPSPSPSTSASPRPRPYSCGYASRSRAVSFDRPYQFPGDGQFFRFEYPMLYWLESQGMWAAYTTDVDLHEGWSTLSARSVFLSVGHDEYYSTPMRRALELSLSTGTSLAFFGGNDMYRHIRFEDSPLGPDRVEVNYKEAASDPMLRTDRREVTTQWREWPLNEPEQALLGAQYECNPVRAPWVATGNPAWLFRGTGLAPGDEVPDLVGYEYDRVMPGYPQPPNVVLVANSPVRCGGRTVSNSTFYVSPSGGSVFDAGTLWFTCALGPGGCVNAQDPHMKPDVRMQRLVRNLIFAMLSKRYA